jgi:hypothetical protein
MKEIVEQLKKFLNENKICVSFEWIENEEQGIWVKAYEDERGKLKIVVDLDRITCLGVIFGFLLSRVYSSLSKEKALFLADQICKSLTFEEKRELIQIIKANVERKCQEIM